MLDVSLFFHEFSVVTSKLDPNYNLVYKFNNYLFIYFIVIHPTTLSVCQTRVLFFSYVNIRMIKHSCNNIHIVFVSVCVCVCV